MMCDPDLHDKLSALVTRLEYDGSAEAAGMVRGVLEGRRDDREFVLRLRFQAFVRSMREVEDSLRAAGVLDLASDLSRRIDDAVVRRP